jgi:hypothetical protein
MRFEDLTQEQIDEKILSFQNNNKDLKGHNLYYAVTVNEDGTIADEAYGANLMTNRGFMMTYHKECTQSDWYNYRFMIGTGYTNDNGTTYTGHPELTDECMKEYVGICTSWTQSLASIITSYDDMGTTDEGVIYQVSRIGYGYFDYQHSLPTNDNPTIAGHYGGTPDGRTVNGSTVVDSRWQQDEIGWYFNITEMGGTYDGIYSVRHNNNYYYYCTDGSSNPGGWATRNVIWHFLLLDYNGNPQPLKKRYNQKLFIYVYHTLILPEKMIIDNWKDKQYLMMNPEGYNRGYHSDAIYVSPISHYNNYVAWQSQNPVTDRNRGTGSYTGGIIANTSDVNNIYSYSGGGQPWDTDPYGTTDGVSVTYQFTFASRLVEDPWVFISYYLMGGTYWNSGSHTGYDTIRGQEFLVTYDELDEPDEITTEIYCNNSQSDRISDQFGETPNTSAKNGLIPIMDMETPPTYAYLYNYDTKECDIPVELYIPQNTACGQYFYAQRVLIDNLILNQMLCPDGATRTCNAYFNPFAYKENDPDYAGIHPGKIITAIDKTSVTLFAADKYWDISTWTQFIDKSNMGTQTDTNGHLLVQKKYFVAYDTSTASNRELWLTFRDEDYPKIVPHTENVDLFTLPYHDITGMIGNDDYNYFTIGNGVVKLSGEPGVGLDNTLALDTCYYLQHDYFSSLFHARQAYGKNIMFKMRHNTRIVDMWDITEESTIPSWNHQYKALKNHFACDRYHSDCYEDHNNGRYMILSGNSGTDDILGEHGYGITIFDNALDVEAEYPETIEDITSVMTVARPSESGYEFYTRNYLSIAMNNGEYVEVDPDDVIYGIIDCNLTRNNNNYYLFFGAVFDENKTLLYVFEKRTTPFWIRHPDAKYARIYFTNVNNGDVSDNMQNPYNVWFVKNKNYGLDMPYIENARHGICVKGSSNLMAYNDASEGCIYLKTWHIINMSDPVDANGDPKILQTFEIDENFIGGTFTGGIGFSHYVYLRMNDMNDNYSFWLYDITSQELKHLASTTWNGFNDSTGNRHACFVGNDDVLCYCGGINNNSITSSNINYGSNIYCITADDPETLHTLWSSRNTITSLQLKTVNWGTTANPKNQLLLAAYGRYSGSGSYYRQRIVLDIGKWLKTKSWPNGEPGSYWDSRSGSGDTGNYNDGHIYAYIYKKGVIELKDGDTSLATSQLSYRPLENFLPMEFTCTTNTINAFNNPIQINGKTYTFTKTNNMKAINVNLDENASNVWKQNTD